VQFVKLQIVQQAVETAHDAVMQPTIAFVTGFVNHFEVTANKPRALDCGARVTQFL
jgi:hypothetical protein